ncbi:Gfo/Idh/MocA family protein [Georgenia sp. Z1344]|uniref:Gfo/Idh/MocA family protein n=1 Tax=Georgenia sp. Z1344 TaxID=3416706 RepID=UPI003CEFA7A6
MAGTTATDAPLRVGLIGLGSMGRHHARVIRETEGMDLVAVADPGGDRFGVAGSLTVGSDVESLIDAGIEAAMVAVPTIYHEEVALKLAEAGIHTMVEKPIAHDVAAGRRVAGAFEEAGLTGAVGYVERCNPAIVALRDKLAEGFLGEIYQIQTFRQGPFPARISDVGVVKDLATHDVDLAAFVAGSPYSSIWARTTHRSGREFEDMVLATGQLADGTMVGHTVNWLSPFKERRTVVTGERGALVADTLNIDLTFYANGTIPTEWDAVAAFRGVSEGDITTYAIPKREPLRVEQERFRDAVRGEGDEVVSMAEGVHTLEVVEAILSAAGDGVAVQL